MVHVKRSHQVSHSQGVKGRRTHEQRDLESAVERVEAGTRALRPETEEVHTEVRSVDIHEAEAAVAIIIIDALLHEAGAALDVPDIGLETMENKYYQQSTNFGLLS